MLTQNKIKYIRSLDIKKNRQQNGCFIVEGEKMVVELIESNFKIVELFALPDFISQNIEKIKNRCPFDEITERELKKISSLKTPNQVVAIAEIPKYIIEQSLFTSLNIALDNIQDPGNLGTIIRTANWFGVKNIFCSHNTVDTFNPKVIQATMGAIFRTNIVYCDLTEVIEKTKNSNLQVYGALLDGENIYSSKLNNSGLIVLGNESKGISEPIQKLIDIKIRIPNFPIDSTAMESLNVGIANAVILAEFRRQAK